MNQRDLLNKISNYLATFQLQVKISTKNNLYDINVHSETVLIPLLNLLYNGNFENLNHYDKNADTVDLLDRDLGMAFQVTATNKLEKVKRTLAHYLESKYRSEIKNLFIYILTEKQSSYSEESLKKIIGKKIPFSVSQNIIDASDLFAEIKALTDIDKIKEVYHILRKQFSELYLLENFTRTDFLKFKQEYAKSCLTNFKRLNFFGLSVSNRPRELALYELFVQPRFKVSSVASNKFLQEKARKELAKKDKENPGISFLQRLYVYDLSFSSNLVAEEDEPDNFSGLFTFRKHAVILGNPGAGKSSIVKYAICKILELEEVFLDETVLDTLPVRIELHRYNKIRVEKNIGFITYLTYLFKDEYHSPITEEHLIQILRHFPTLLFFDGLDEIFDIQERIEVRNDIEGLIKTFELARAIVTSRYESYTEVKLDNRLFEPLEVMNFDDGQVKDYVNKWYNIEEGKHQIRTAEISHCLEQLIHVDGELKYNPLLLSLILILYRNELEIPTSKLQIYENCTTTIMEHRDTKEKKLDFRLQITNPLAIFSALAYWQFENDEARATINYEEVHRYLKQYFLQKGEFEDGGMAGKAATQFLDFAKIRSIYFENKFTHKTFLEFFVANYLHSTYFLKPDSKRTFYDVITENMGVASWNVVLELLISQVDGGQIDFDVMDRIIDEQLSANPWAGTIFFLNLVRYLKNIRPAKIEMLLEQGILLCFRQPPGKSKGPITISRLFGAIVNLVRLPRFQPPFMKAFTVLTDHNDVSLIDLSIFAYEFHIVSDDDSLLKVINKIAINESSDYLDLLKNYSSLSQREGYLKLISSKIKDGKQTPYFRQVYTSRFGQKLFFDAETFNYPISYLMNCDPSTIEEDYNALKDTGLEFTEILAASKIKSGLFKFTPEQMYLLQEKIQNKELHRVLKIIQQIHFPLVQQETKPAKFYDAFYRKPNGRDMHRK